MAFKTSTDFDSIAEINITPLVDVMLVLLIIFIVTAPMLVQGLEVELPREAASQLKPTPREPIDPDHDPAAARSWSATGRSRPAACRRRSRRCSPAVRGRSTSRGTARSRTAFVVAGAGRAQPHGRRGDRHGHGAARDAMIDAVGEELARRWSEPWPWRSALGIAIALHVAAGRAPRRRADAPAAGPSASVGPGSHGRAAAASLPARRPAGAPRRRREDGPGADQAGAEQDGAASPEAAAPLGHPGREDRGGAHGGAGAATARRRAAGRASRRRPAAAPPERARPGAESRSARARTGPRSRSRSPTTSTAFSAVLESNWFSPPAPADTRCRVRCRVDRAGRLLEAGIEEASGVAAFDRAALRAVYASTPFPPLPLGFSGQALTVHLDFGPQ